MRKFLFLAVFLTSVIWGMKISGFTAYAANGCGGTAFCGTVNVNVKSCSKDILGNCHLTPIGISASCQIATEEKCEGWADSERCGSNQCNYDYVRINCCTTGGGGGTPFGCPPGFPIKICEDVCSKDVPPNERKGFCRYTPGEEEKYWHEVCHCEAAPSPPAPLASVVERCTEFIEV